MAFSNVLETIARTFLTRERDRLGITGREQAAQSAQLQDMVRQAQIAKALQDLELGPAEQESQIGLRTAQTEAARAQAEAAQALAGQRSATPPKTIKSSVNLGDRTIIQYSDGTTETVARGATPKAAGGDDGGEAIAANPFPMTDAKGNVRMAVRVKGGGIRWLDEVGGVKVGPAPTAEMRNTEYQSAAVEPAFELVRATLDDFEASIKGGLPGGPSALIPGTQANFAKSRYIDQAKALLGAIVARQAGEGSRLSDEDRAAYSQAAALVNSAILLPGGTAEARGRIDQAQKLLREVMQRRKMVGGGQDPNAGAAPPADSAGGLDPAVQNILNMLEGQ